MDNIIEFKLKQGGKNKKKILCVILKQKRIIFNENIKKEVVKKYVEYISTNPEIYIIIDSRAVDFVDPKLLWEGSSDLYKYNSILKKNIKGTSVLISNKFLKDTIDVILKLYPLESPTKFCKNNAESMEFIYKCMGD